MSYNVDKIFEDVVYLTKVHNKASYESNTNRFKDERYDELSDLVKAEDVAAESQKFCEDVFISFKKLFYSIYRNSFVSSLL